MNRMKRRLKTGIGRKIGAIKWGMKHPTKGYPVSLDYFRMDSQLPAVLDAFRECYGDRPRDIVIRIGSPNDVTHTENLFDGIRTYAKTDGEALEYYDRDKDGNRRTTVYDASKIAEMGGMERAKIVIRNNTKKN